MGIFHFSSKIISRNKGRSVVGSAAYRSGQKLYNKYDGRTHDYTRKTGVIHTEILLPKDAPIEYYDRQILWNAVESSEKRSDSQTAREIEIALPRELELSDVIELVRNFVNDSFVNLGMCADVAIHDKHCKNKNYSDTAINTIISQSNPHAHILLTTRLVQQDGFYAKKNREWNKKENLVLWRKKWAQFQNHEFERKGLEIRVSHESYEVQGINREATKHLGHIVTELERKGIRTDRGNKNRAIMDRNRKKEEERQHEQDRVRSRTKSRSR